MNYGLGDGQEKFLDLIWDKEPIGSGELVKLCKNSFDWEKSTTYTILKKLINKGLVKNENSIVTSVYDREKYYSLLAKSFVISNFEGSLLKFMKAYMDNAERTMLPQKEADEIIQIIWPYALIEAMDKLEKGTGNEEIKADRKTSNVSTSNLLTIKEALNKGAHTVGTGRSTNRSGNDNRAR